MRDINDLVQWATSHHGLLTLHASTRLGADGPVMRRICRSGAFTRVAPGLFRLPGSPDTWGQRLGILCLGTSPPAVASHRSALRLWEMRTVDDEVEATVRRPRTRRVAGSVIHRSCDLQPEDVTWIDGLPVTNPVRAICDAGAVFPDSEVQRILDHAVATDLVTVADLVRFRHRVGRQGRNGVGVLHRALECLPDDAEDVESGPELALLRLCAERGLPRPAVQLPIVAGGRRYRADLAYPEARLLIEYDGFAVHSDPDRFESDRQRQNALLLEGWTVLRFTKSDIRHHPGRILREIEQALRPAFGRVGRS